MWGRITIAAVIVVVVAIWLAAIWFVFITDLQFKWERRAQFLMNGSLQLFEYPQDIVRLSCEKCGRSGQYRKQNLTLI